VCQCTRSDRPWFDAGSPSCEFGKFKTTPGNLKCDECPFEDATTATKGSTSIDECVCEKGYVAIPNRNSSDAVRRTCRLCDEVVERGKSGHQCEAPGVSLEQLPVASGFWRQSASSQHVRECITEGACVESNNVSHQCARSQRGPYCAVCAEGFHGGRDGVLCEECTGDSGTHVGVTIAGALVVVAAIAVVLYHCRHKIKLNGFSRNLTTNVGAEMSAPTAPDLRRSATDKLREERPRLVAAMEWVHEHAVSIGVKMRILISLVRSWEFNSCPLMCAANRRV
jgi:hypothetical protein